MNHFDDRQLRSGAAVREPAQEVFMTGVGPLQIGRGHHLRARIDGHPAIGRAIAPQTIKVIEGEAERIHQRVAGIADARARELDQLLPCGLRGIRGRQAGVDVVGRRRGRRAQHLREDELAAQHRRRLRSVGEVRRDASLCQKPGALTGRQRHRHEVGPGYAGDPVIRRELLIQVRDGAGKQGCEQPVALAQGLVDKLPSSLR